MCARCPGTQDATADQYGRARQTVVFLLILYHWRHHAARLATGSTPARYVYHRRQVAVLQDVCLSVCPGAACYQTAWLATGMTPARHVVTVVFVVLIFYQLYGRGEGKDMYSTECTNYVL